MLQDLVVERAGYGDGDPPHAQTERRENAGR
jgi:hypothetical protein